MESRTAAQEAISAGLVLVDGAPGLKPSTQVHAGQAILVSAPPRAYVSRGGHKLAHALETFGIDVEGLQALDAGVSTGGFSDCLLQRGARRVVAVDVGYGQVHERIRTDPRVSVRERTNIRDLRPDDLEPLPPELVVADLSFISVASVVARLRALVAPEAAAILLVKPQFEAERHEVGRGGVVRDPDVWRRCLQRVVDAAAEVGWRCEGATASPLLGPAGNVEFLVHLAPAATTDPAPDAALDTALDAAVAEGIERRSSARSSAEGARQSEHPS